MEDTRGSSFSSHGKWALYVPILLFAAGTPFTSAQCSQAPRPEAGSSALANSSTREVPGVTGAGGSSSADTPPALHFGGDAVTVLEETSLQVMNNMPISSRTTRAGDKLSFTVTRDVIVDGVLVIPCGATVFGTVVAAKQAGRLVGASNITLQFTALNLDGRSYPLYSPPFTVVGTSKTRPTATKMAIGAAVGGLAAAATAPTNQSYTLMSAGGADKTVHYSIPIEAQVKGDALAAGLGAGVGAAIAAASPPSIATIPPESQIEFTLASPIAVYPVSQRTAARLAQGLHNGGPVLYVRGESQ